MDEQLEKVLGNLYPLNFFYQIYLLISLTDIVFHKVEL